MTMLYGKIAQNLKGTAVMPLAWLVFTVIMIVCGKMWWEDYMTSWYGYLDYPTQKATDVVWAVALLPQLVQMGTAYITIGLAKTSKSERTWFGYDMVPLSLLVWFAAFVLDGYWDYLYKAANYLAVTPFYLPGIIESFGVYGLGSEVLGTFALAVWVALTKEGAFTELVDLLVEVAEMFANAVALIVITIKKVAHVLASPFKAKDNKKQNRGQTNQAKHKPSQQGTSPKRDPRYEPGANLFQGRQ